MAEIRPGCLALVADSAGPFRIALREISQSINDQIYLSANDDPDAVTNGEFDATVADFGFLHGIKFSGSLVLNPDCTGTFTFTTSAGTTRTDTIIVLGPGHVRAMSQDVQFLWTYDMHRL